MAISKEEKRKRDKEYYYKNREAKLKQKADKLKNRTPEQRQADLEKRRLDRLNRPEAYREANRKHYRNNRDVRLSDVQKYRKENPEKVKESQRKYYENNREKILNTNKGYFNNNKDSIYKKRDEYRRNNLGYFRALNAKRHASKLQATPKWLTEQHKIEIQHFYDLAVKLTAETKIKHEVDHIIPLQGETVSGLHVPWNLRVITKSENSSKRNFLIKDLYE